MHSLLVSLAFGATTGIAPTAPPAAAALLTTETDADEQPCMLTWEIQQPVDAVRDALLKSAASQPGYSLKQGEDEMVGTYTSPAGKVQHITIKNMPFRDIPDVSYGAINGASNKEGRAALLSLMPGELKAVVYSDSCPTKPCPLHCAPPSFCHWVSTPFKGMKAECIPPEVAAEAVVEDTLLVV